MKLSTNWLKEITPGIKINNKLIESLTSLGLEVSNVSKIKKDTIIDLDITPNRSDCLSIYGVARDLFSIYGKTIKPLKQKKISIKKSQLPLAKINSMISPIYSCLTIENIDNKIKTPQYIKTRLSDYGIIANNIIVDILNYVMIEIGQPMHAFDSDKISGKLSVRFGKKNETFHALDGQKYLLNNNIPIVTDSNGIQAIAGVIGGKNSSVQINTKNIIIECAYFNPEFVRLASKKFRLQTDASYRFERGVDPLMHSFAIGRVLSLLSEHTTLHKTNFFQKVDKLKIKTNNKIKINIDKFTQILGQQIPKTKIIQILKRLNFHPTIFNNIITVIVPSYRFDIENGYDLIEELARVVGYNYFKPTALPVTTSANIGNNNFLEKYSSYFISRGYHETVSFSFLPKNSQNNFIQPSKIIAIKNPISEDKSELRTSLIHSLIKTYKYNFSRQVHDIKIFENGNTYVNHNSNSMKEVNTISGLISGKNYDSNLKVDTKDLSFFDLKGDLLSIFPDLTFVPSSKIKTLSNSCQALIFQNKKYIGYCGEISDELYRENSVKNNVYIFELFADDITMKSSIIYKKISPFPRVKRDLTVLVDDNIAGRDIIDVIERESFKYMINIKINDIFYNRKEFGKDIKSVSIEFCFQDANGTLTDNIVNKQMDLIFNHLAKCFKAKLRK